VTGGNGRSPRRGPAGSGQPGSGQVSPGGYQPRITTQPAPPPAPPRSPSGVGGDPQELHLYLEQRMDWRVLLAGAACMAIGMLAADLINRSNRH
jgi:hypothetical protein